MLPTSPRSSVRSTCSSWTAPCSTRATRVSWGDQLIRMSCMFLESEAGPAQQLRRLEHRETHDARMRAADVLDESCGPALDGVGAGLAHWFAGGDVVGD